MEEVKKTRTFELLDEIHIDLNRLYEEEYAKRFSDKALRFLKILTSTSLSYSRILARDDKDLQELVKCMEEYSRDPKNVEAFFKYLEEEKPKGFPIISIQTFREKIN